jgi:hypothetical protein
MKMNSSRILVRFFVAAGLVGVCVGLAFFLQRGAVVAAQDQARDPLATNVPDGFTVAAVGDIIEAHPATPNSENKPILQTSP